MDKLDFTALREYALQNTRKKWYREVKQLWDESQLVKPCLLHLRDNYRDIYEHLKTLAPNYYVGKRASILNTDEVYAFVYPKLENKCQVCGTLVGYNKWRDRGWYKGCSVSHGTIIAMQGARERWLDETGVDNPMKLDSVKETLRDSVLQKYGVDNPLKDTKVKAKVRKTMKKRYGVSHVSELPDILERRKQGSIKKHGVEHPMQISEIKDKMMNNRDANPDNYKSSYAYKLIKDRFGKTHRVQGYETRAIEFFSRKKGMTRNVTEIISGSANVPRYRYKSVHGTTHNYYPDLLVKSKSGEYVVEVKSDYTLNNNLDNNLRKFATAIRSCKRVNRTFVLLVYYQNDVDPTVLVNPTKSDLKSKGLLW